MIVIIVNHNKNVHDLKKLIYVQKEERYFVPLSCSDVYGIMLSKSLKSIPS